MDIIFKKVKNTITKFKLFSKSSKIFVACSGGKDSTTILYILKKLGYNPHALTVNALIGNYSKENLVNLEKFCNDLNVPLHIISFRDEFGHSLCYLRSLLHHKGVNIKSCSLCGVLRRYLINKHARSLKADVLITGHNLDDEAQSILMNLLKNNLSILARIGPKTGLVKDKRFIPRVKPLYFVTEKEVEIFSKKMKFPVVYTPCPCRVDSFRNQVRMLLDSSQKSNIHIKKNIVDYFLTIKPSLVKKFSSSQSINICQYCNEPSSNNICRSCQIIEKIK